MPPILCEASHTTRPRFGTLPNLNRNLNSLVILASGATPTFNPRGGQFTTVNGAQAGQIDANGGRSKSTSTQLDYTDANDWEFGGIALEPNATPDMLGEFQILTNNWAAEYGVKSSAEIVMVQPERKQLPARHRI